MSPPIQLKRLHDVVQHSRTQIAVIRLTLSGHTTPGTIIWYYFFTPSNTYAQFYPLAGSTVSSTTADASGYFEATICVSRMGIYSVAFGKNFNGTILCPINWGINGIHTVQFYPGYSGTYQSKYFILDGYNPLPGGSCPFCPNPN